MITAKPSDLIHLQRIADLERELAEAEKQINVLIAGLTEQTVRADEKAAYAEGLADALKSLRGIIRSNAIAEKTGTTSCGVERPVDLCEECMGVDGEHEDSCVAGNMLAVIGAALAAEGEIK